MRFKNSPQLPGAGKARAWHHHGSDTPTSPRAILHHTDTILCTFMHTTVTVGLNNFVNKIPILTFLKARLSECHPYPSINLYLTQGATIILW